jgi:hypothetical protein
MTVIRKTFTDQKPRDGDTILHCGHLRQGQGPVHWFQYETIVRFERPDGTRGDAEWLVVCEPCFVEHGVGATVRGDVQWTGDAPVFEKMEN